MQSHSTERYFSPCSDTIHKTFCSRIHRQRVEALVCAYMSSKYRPNHIINGCIEPYGVRNMLDLFRNYIIMQNKVNPLALDGPIMTILYALITLQGMCLPHVPVRKAITHHHFHEGDTFFVLPYNNFNLTLYHVLQLLNEYFTDPSTVIIKLF